jgi:Protein of unknown function (DUF3095)
MSSSFYDLITPYKNFNDLTTDSYFQKVPEDWSIIITDVKGSTEAIKAGKYKDVNTIGAASIVVARKAMGKKDFPFVFGGDGATLLIPNSYVTKVSEELCALKALAQANFSMDLRVGLVTVSEIYKLNKNVEVGKYELTQGRCVATLRGDGINLAEELIKSNREKYEINLQTKHKSDLTGLSCRWQPIPSRNGKILSLLVVARTDEKKLYQSILKKLESLFPEGVETLNPAITEKSSYKSISQCFKDEFKYHPSIFSMTFIKRFLEIIPAVILFKFSIPVPFLRKYKQSMQSHSDFRKFDNTLRMVIDCAPAKVAELKKYLEEMYQEGKLYYGTLESDNSLMTCFVEGLNQGEHIHFMDAENGGYAAAAVQLKHQIKMSKSSISVGET